MNSRVLPLLAIIISVAIFFGYVNPTWTGRIARTKAAIASDDQALAAAKAYDAQENTLAAARNAIDPAALSRLSTFLPDSVDNVGIILDLNALAARSGLSLSSVDVSKNSANAENPSGAAGTSSSSAGTGSVGSVDLLVSATGTYSAFQSFLQGTEKSLRLLDVQDLAVNGSETGTYTYTMTLRLYWLQQ